MNNYRLTIELSFESQAEAEELMDVCAPLIVQASKEQEKILIDALSGQIEQHIESAKRLVEDVTPIKDNLTRRLQESQGKLESITGVKKNAQTNLEELSHKLESGVEKAKSYLIAINKLLEESKQDISEYNNKVDEFEVEVERAKKLAESMQFLYEMMNLNYGIISGGNVVLEQKKYDAGYGKEAWKPISRLHISKDEKGDSSGN